MSESVKGEKAKGRTPVPAFWGVDSMGGDPVPLGQGSEWPGQSGQDRANHHVPSLVEKVPPWRPCSQSVALVGLVAS